MCNWVTGLYFTKSNNYFTATTQNTTKLNMARPNPASMRNFWELKHKELKYPVYSRNDMSGKKKKKKSSLLVLSSKYVKLLMHVFIQLEKVINYSVSILAFLSNKKR